MNLGVQYYRAPFPESRYWEDDFARIRDSGLNTVQLWVIWAWVESRPGRWVFDDYDRLVALAAKHGLGVVLSTIGEIHPLWIHREVPGSEMIDHMGHKVISSGRGEVHFGLTPGGCTDHPGVWDRLTAFLTATADHYKSAPHVRGWDAWNETRWNVQADGLVCFCEHTLAAFRQWLDAKYGGLDGLNAAWKRRYGCWEEVMPGKVPPRPYTEMMAFQHFLTWRSNQIGIRRARAIKQIVGDVPVTIHGPAPCATCSGQYPIGTAESHDQALNRGNDWFMADAIDGIGCSNFPTWWGMDEASYVCNVGMIHSAARGKQMWFSEVQGGRAVQGYTLTGAVRAFDQQRWVWHAIAGGADTLLFWCWRDEVFGKESSGYGLSGDDGFAEERLAAMRVTGKLIAEHRALLDAYEPLPARAGVFFSPQSYYLNWAQEANAAYAKNALEAYCLALTRRSIPFRMVEEEHLDELDSVRLLFMPRTMALSDETTERLRAWVEAGGTLVCEAECGAFDPRGFYRYPADRFTAALAGIREVGRRPFARDTIAVKLSGQSFRLRMKDWMSPWQAGKGQVLAGAPQGSAVVRMAVGQGALVLCGAFLGEPYRAKPYADFERFVGALAAEAAAEPGFRILSPRPAVGAEPFVHAGQAGDRKAVFVFAPREGGVVRVRFAPGFFRGAPLTDLMSGRKVPVATTANGQTVLVKTARWGMAVLVDRGGASSRA